MAATSHAVSDPAEREVKIVGVVEEVVRDLHVVPVGAIVVLPTSRLDRDLGIDSIGRTELMLRIERVLHLKLPTSVLTEVETVGDLIQAIERAAARVAPLHAAAPASPRTLPPVNAPAGFCWCGRTKRSDLPASWHRGCVRKRYRIRGRSRFLRKLEARKENW